MSYSDWLMSQKPERQELSMKLLKVSSDLGRANVSGDAALKESLTAELKNLYNEINNYKD